MEIKTARNWYWWLWLSPILTLPTLGLIIGSELFSPGPSSTQIFYTGVFVSGLWHLILLKPARHPSSKFIRWHGWQALSLAGIRTISAFLVVLLGDSGGSVIVIIFMILVWFVGTLFGLVQASRGACILWSWFGNQDMGPLLEPEPEPKPKSEPVKTRDDFLEKDADALVEIIRFSTDLDQRQTALEKLDQLGLVESLDGESQPIKTAYSTQSPIKSGQTPIPEKSQDTSYPDLKKDEKPARKNKGWGWIILFFIIIGLLFGPSLCRRAVGPSGYLSPAPTATKTLLPEEIKSRDAEALIDSVFTLAYNGSIEEAMAAISEALELDPDVFISSGVWNDLCWFGALNGYAAAVFEACETAVALNPTHGGHRDSRGLALAILGKYSDAIEDFEAYIDWAQADDYGETQVLERQRWIEDLEKGINPFDLETLEALRVP